MTPGSWEYLLAGHAIEERAGEANALGKQIHRCKIYFVAVPNRCVDQAAHLALIGGT
jgi:hypothetical protein